MTQVDRGKLVLEELKSLFASDRAVRSKLNELGNTLANQEYFASQLEKTIIDQQQEIEELHSREDYFRKRITRLTSSQETLKLCIKKERQDKADMLTPAGVLPLINEVGKLVSADIERCKPILDEDTASIGDCKSHLSDYLSPKRNLIMIRASAPIAMQLLDAIFPAGICDLIEATSFTPSVSATVANSTGAATTTSSTIMNIEKNTSIISQQQKEQQQQQQHNNDLIKWKWLATMCLLYCHIPSWHSKFTFFTNKAIINEKNVAGAAKLHMMLMPASYSYSQQLRIENGFADEQVLQDPTFNLKENLVVFCYDNIQVRHLKTTETGAGYSGQTVDVRTMRIALLFPNKEWGKLQRDYKHSPMCMANKYPLSNVPLDAICLSETPSQDNEENLSDNDYLHAEFSFLMTDAVEQVLSKGDEWRTEARGVELINQLKNDVEKDQYRKTCLESTGGCGNKNFSRHGFCRFCGSALPSLQMVRSEELKLQNVDKSDGHSNLKQESSTTRKLRSNEETLEEKQHYSTSKSYDFQEGSGSDYEEVDSSHEQSVESITGTCQAERVVLSICDLNPAGHDNQEMIQNYFSTLCGRGTPGGVITTGLCADAGALNIGKILHDEIENFWIIVGLGHTEMAVTRVCMKIMIACLGNQFVYAHKFKKGSNGPQYLKSCKSNHKAFTFVQLCNRSLMVEFVKVYLLDVVGRDGVLVGNVEEIATNVYSYLHADTNDIMFKNLVFASQVVSAASMFRKALRDNRGRGNAWAQDAAMKIFIPLFYRFGFVKYAPFMHWQLIRVNYRVTPEVQHMLRRTTSVDGQGIEFTLEQDIQRVMRTAKGTRNGYDLQKATVDLRYRPDFRRQVNCTLGKNANVSRPLRRGIDRARDMEDFGLVFRINDTVRKDENRTSRITSVDKEFLWAPGVLLENEYHKGQQAAMKNQANSFNNPVPLSTKLLVDAEETGVRSPSDNFEEEELNESSNNIDVEEGLPQHQV